MAIVFGKVSLDVIDLGPARAGASLSERALEYLRGADRLIDKLAPAALLSPRFNLMGDDQQTVELASLAAWFYQLTRLPKLAGLEVLRTCLAEGVRQGVFGLASGSDWADVDAVLRFQAVMDPNEVQFQPGTWLVRAGAMKELLAEQGQEVTIGAAGGTRGEEVGVASAGEGGEGHAKPKQPAPGTVGSVVITIRGVPAEKARDVVKVAILPLHAKSTGADFDIVIRADGGLAGIPQDVLELTVREGLRQLGLGDAAIETTPE